jgi:hypothetical protein
LNSLLRMMMIIFPPPSPKKREMEWEGGIRGL